MIGIQPSLQVAEWRYLHDAEFHARVEIIVRTMEQDQGVVFDRGDRNLVTYAAAVALSTVLEGEGEHRD